MSYFHDSYNGLAEFRVRDSEDGAVTNAWHRHEHMFDLGGVDVYAA